MIFLIYYGLTDGKEKLWSLALGLMLYNGSVLAEVFRAGVNAVPRGQSEAAFALGHAQVAGDASRSCCRRRCGRCCRRSSASSSCC